VNRRIIYIPLLDEGTDVWRPTDGEAVSDLIFRVLPTADYDPQDEHCAFPPGTLVRCVAELREGKEVLVAIERI
jgi:hypothetical protein